MVSTRAGTPVDETFAIPSAEADSGTSPNALSDRALRFRRSRSRRPALTTPVAVAVTILVPSVVVLSMWRMITEAFWFNEQWRAFDISEANNWWFSLRHVGAPFPAGC